MTPYIIDTTLRDGEQAPGVAFSIEDKMAIASLLNELGVDEVEAGTPAISSTECKAIREIADAGFSFKTSSWCRARIEDLELASRLKTDSVNISLPVSDIQMETLGKSRSWVLAELKNILKFASQNFPFITMGAQDASRADIDFLKEYIFFARDYGAGRIRVNDTVGIMDPIETKELFSELSWNFPGTEFEFHGHNDLGMATANAISALNSGADCISGTINGLGERAGNSVIEEVIAYLNIKGAAKRYNTSVLKELSALVAEKANFTLPYNKPVTGRDVYSHESGVHTAAMLKNIKSYQVLNPVDYGVAKTSFTFGKHSGGTSLKSFLASKGLIFDEQDIKTLLNKIEDLALFKKRAVTESEVLSLFNQIPKRVITK